MKENRIYPVRVTLGEDQRTYSREFQHSEDWKRVLTLAHGKGIVECMCRGKGEKRLSIHCHSASDRFHLARFPNTGPEHSEDCIYYGVDPRESGMGGYKKGVIEELDDGSTKIRLKIGLQQRPSSAPEEESTSASSKPAASGKSRSQSSMTLLGLLHYLWTEARLNTWTPRMKGKRSLGVVHHHILEVASRTYAGRVRLARNLLVGTYAEDGAHAQGNKAKALAAYTERRRLIVITPLVTHNGAVEATKTLPISGYNGIPHLLMPQGMWEECEKRFRVELGAWSSGERVIAIAQTDPPRRGDGSLAAEVIDLGLMWVTKDWIPVESGYEAIVAEKLISEDRIFEKPLRFDSSEATFPDFLLKDTGSRTPLEVWGLTSADYEERKRAKEAHYNATLGAAWWSWNAAAGDPIPGFPPKATHEERQPEPF